MGIEKLLEKEQQSLFLLANEAAARAVLECDVKVAAFYPGSPTSEILDTLYALSSSLDDLRVEVATNEKVALETMAGASMGGLRSFTSMKSVGLNVASDAFYSLGYTGVNAGAVLVVADDPHAHSSQSEQDGRFFAMPAHVPMFEPATAQEMYDMVTAAYALSEKHRTLALVRTTTRVNHQSSIVRVGSLNRVPFARSTWGDVGRSYYTLAARARELKGAALEKIENIEKEFEHSPFNDTVEGEGPVGIITSGVSYLHTLEALDVLNINPPVLKLGTTFPLPHETVAAFLEPLETVIVIEELLPYLEHHVTAIAKDANPDVSIFGKRSGHFGQVGEYTVPRVVDGIAAALGIASPVDYDRFVARATELKQLLPERMPTFCAGCPHRGTLWAVQQAIKGTDVVVNNDIGCYSMLLLKPYEITDSLLCMGSSLGLSAGMQHALSDRILALVGDSTFFHAALPGLVNAVHNRHDITVVILDNSVTAMTGQQPNPGSDFGTAPVDKIDIETVVRAVGVKHVTVIDAFDPKANVDLIKEALAFKGVSVVISKGPCALYRDRLKRRSGEPIVPNRVDGGTCRSIYAGVNDFYCPAIHLEADSRKSVIQQDLCDGCMVCARLCPVQAINSTGGDR